MKISDIVKKSLTPLMILNGVMLVWGAAVLLSAGLWQSLYIPVIAFGASVFVFPLLLFPTALFAGLMQMFTARKPLLAQVMMALSIGWLVAVIGFYLSFMLALVTPFLATVSPWPVLAWGIGSGMIAWAIFAAKDRENVMVTGIVLMSQAAITASALMIAPYGLALGGIFINFFLIMTVLLLMQAVYERFVLEKKSLR